MRKRCIIGYRKFAKWRFWSDCANAQADLNLRWAHVSEGAFSDVAAQIVSCEAKDDHCVPSVRYLFYSCQFAWFCHEYQQWNISCPPNKLVSSLYVCIALQTIVFNGKPLKDKAKISTARHSNDCNRNSYPGTANDRKYNRRLAKCRDTHNRRLAKCRDTHNRRLAKCRAIICTYLCKCVPVHCYNPLASFVYQYIFDIFLTSRNLFCGYSLELSCRVASNE